MFFMYSREGTIMKRNRRMSIGTHTIHTTNTTTVNFCDDVVGVAVVCVSILKILIPCILAELNSSMNHGIIAEWVKRERERMSECMRVEQQREVDKEKAKSVLLSDWRREKRHQTRRITYAYSKYTHTFSIMIFCLRTTFTHTITSLIHSWYETLLFPVLTTYSFVWMARREKKD